ncbi:MAG: hypothetical protein QXK06_01145 [Candidatus Diapherotrites archaeon]
MPSRKKPIHSIQRQTLSPTKRARVSHEMAFSLLPIELQKQIPKGNARQRFNAAFDRLSRQRSSALQPMREKDMKVIARATASLIIGGKPVIVRKTSKKSVIGSGKSPYCERLPEFERIAWSKVPARQRVVLSSGAQGEFFAFLGRGLPGLMPGEPQTYISFKPFFNAKKHPQLQAMLRFKYGTDFIEQISGSIHFVAAKFHKEIGHEKPVLVIWNDQSRHFNSLPESLKQSYKGLPYAFFDFLEGIARLGGADRIAFASPEHAKKFSLNIELFSDETDYRKKREALARNVLAHYQRLERKLEERGYHRTELNLGIKDKTAKAPFLVKQL